MKTKTTVLSILGPLLVAATAASGAPGPIDGAWAAKVPTPNGQGSLDVVFTFKPDGSKLTGTAAKGGGTSNLVDTSISGDTIGFAIEGEPERFTGTVAGDEIAMEVTFKSRENGDRTWSFVARRAVAAKVEAGEPSLDGEWTGEVPRGGSRFIAADFEFHVDGKTLTGRVRAVDEEFEVNGTVEGPRIAFTVGSTAGDYSGELAGDTIKMKVKYNGGEAGRQTLGFVLTRVKH